MRIAAYIQLSYKGILDELGWFKSFYSMQSIDKNGNPIPWCTYSFINFISERLNSEQSVFEFGSGNSTIWYSQRVKSIVAVEHDLNWFEQIKLKLAKNAEIIFKQLDSNGEYAKTALNRGTKFQIIIIDGRDRNNCVYQSVDALTEDGVFVFDNSQVPSYAESQQFLKQKGFRRIDFKGLCPSVAHSNTTSIFYKPNNCLNI
jgi:hypothetical protein